LSDPYPAGLLVGESGLWRRMLEKGGDRGMWWSGLLNAGVAEE
jgi:hypothetical protein